VSAVASVGLAGLILRSPAQAAEQCRRDGDLRPLVLTSVGAIAVGGAAFGAVVGSFRGSSQILYAAVKLPVALIAALALCVPAFHALAAVFGRPWPMRTVVAITLASAARASLLLLAFSPVLWLSYDLGLDYHRAALFAAGAYGVSGLAALGVLVRGLGAGYGRKRTMLAFAAVFLAAGGQTSWMLRPYLVRPRTEAVPFVRAREGTFIEAMYLVTRSAAGHYDPDSLWEERHHEEEPWDEPPALSEPLPVERSLSEPLPVERARPAPFDRGRAGGRALMTTDLGDEEAQ
jgi:hypothetical protein